MKIVFNYGLILFFIAWFVCSSIFGQSESTAYVNVNVKIINDISTTISDELPSESFISQSKLTRITNNKTLLIKFNDRNLTNNKYNIGDYTPGESFLHVFNRNQQEIALIRINEYSRIENLSDSDNLYFVFNSHNRPILDKIEPSLTIIY